MKDGFSRKPSVTFTEKEKAFIYEYLEPLIDVTKLVFMMLNDIPDIDINKAIDAYYQTSDARLKMDKGNWMALNMGSKQILHSIDLSGCISDNPRKSDGIMLYWIANIYTKWQWEHPELTSKEINKVCSVDALMDAYYPLHETSDEKAVNILHNRYFSKEER